MLKRQPDEEIAKANVEASEARAESAKLEAMDVAGAQKRWKKGCMPADWVLRAPPSYWASLREQTEAPLDMAAPA